MNNDRVLIVNILKDLGRTPLLFLPDKSFGSLTTFLVGYLCALEDRSQIKYNHLFSEWLNRSGKKRMSLTWTVYIHDILAKGNEAQAFDLVFVKLKEFVESNFKTLS
jgi:hypothetical protein